MLRKDFEKNSGSKQNRKGGDSREVPGNTSVHKKNLYLFSLPLIFIFNVFRQLLYHLYLLFKTAGSLAGKARLTFRRKGVQLPHVGSPDKEEAAIQDTQKEMAVRQPGPGDPLLAKQKHHHRRAFEYISKALKIDEENEGTQLDIRDCFCINKRYENINNFKILGHKDMAIELYKKGIAELELGIAVECYGGTGDLYERAQRLHEKMKTNLSMAKDRLQFLGNSSRYKFLFYLLFILSHNDMCL